jgi:hypothetical protein
MPRYVRNFWLKAQIDGQRSPFASGPRSKDGGFSLDILYRERGAPHVQPLRVSGRCVGNRLTLDICDGPKTVFTKEVER